MTKRIDTFVSENRQNIKKIDSTFVPISGQSNQNITFTSNEIGITLSVQVYTRPIGNGLVSGHPNGDTHGSGHGVSGDHRGGWTLVESDMESGEFVRGGRNNIRDLLDGVSGSYIGKAAVGSGTGTAQPLQNSLESENGRVFAWGNPGSASNEADGEAIFRFNEHGGEINEYAMFSASETIYNRLTTATVSPSNEQEVKVVTTFTVTGNGGGSSAITDIGENRVADSFHAIDVPVGIDAIGFGNGTTTAAESDTSLENELFTSLAERQLSQEGITAHTVVFRDEPSSQPVDISEIGIFDNEDNLLWRTTVESFQKDEDVEFDVFVGFDIQ